jgi:hypothetical protein
MPKKPTRKPKSKANKKKGIPPHLQRKQERDTVSEIQRHIDDVAKRQPAS